MQVRIISNVWLDGHIIAVGELAELSEEDAARLVSLGAAEIVPAPPAEESAEAEASAPKAAKPAAKKRARKK